MNVQRVVPSSLTRPWRKVLAANYAGNFPTVDPDLAPAQTGGRPTPAAGQALIDFGSGIVPTEVQVMLFGAGADNNTIKCRVWGFRAANGGFIGSLLWAGTGTLCATTGTAGFDVIDTDRYCDTITTTVGTESVDCRTTSPTGDIPGKVKFFTASAEFLMVEFDKDQATNANALVGEQ